MKKSESTHTAGPNSPASPMRRRMRGFFKSRTGRTAGITSIALPVIYYVIDDLSKPNSSILKLTSIVKDKLLTYRQKKTEAIDISDKVEVTTD